jgi:hypothetical protein
MKPVLLSKHLLCLISAAGAAVTLYMLLVPRSLFWDEAAIAKNLLNRNFQNLLYSPLTDAATVPALYLYLQKVCISVFGDSETSFRLLSFVGFLGVLTTLYLFVKRLMKVDAVFAWTAVAIAATTTLFMEYGSSAKPYMTEAFLILSLLLLYAGFRNNSVRFSTLTFFCSLALLLSNAVLYFIAATFIYELMRNFAEKNKKNALRTIISGLFIVIVFFVYYQLWLAPVADSEYMNVFWENFFFKLSFSGLKDNALLIWYMYNKEILSSTLLCAVFLLCATAGFIISVFQRNFISIIVLLALIIFSAASILHRAPFAPRLCMYILILSVGYFAVFWHALWVAMENKLPRLRYLVVAIAISIFFGNFTFYKNLHFTKYSCETKPLFEYVKNNIKADETLFSFSRSNIAVEYYNRRSNNPQTVGKNGSPIIWGQSIYDWQGVQIDRNNLSGEQIYPWNVLWDKGADPSFYRSEIEEVIQAGKCYLLFANLWLPRQIMFDYGLNELRKAGEVTEIMTIDNTHLYYFQRY